MKTMWLSLALLAASFTAGAVTVNPDGSGDFPTIQDAFDATPSDNVILLGAGIFTGPGNRDLDPGDKKFRLMGATGDAEDVIIDLADPGARIPHRFITLVDPGNEGFRLDDLSFRGGLAPDGLGGVIHVADIVWMDIRACIFEDNQADQGGVVYNENTEVYVVDCFFRLNLADEGGCLYGAGENYFPIWGGRFELNFANLYGGVVATAETSTGSAVLSDAVFWQNSATLSGGVAYLAGTTDGSIYNSTFVENLAPEASSLYLNHFFYLRYNIVSWGNTHPIEGSGVGIEVICNDIYGNENGDYTGPLAGQLGLNGNISQDPQFCGISDGYLALQSDSPCAPEHSSCPDELIGALPVECGEQATILMHWDAVKTLY